ncbi:MAG: tetratricopeptide repeat protein [Acidobacteriota bacterium]
MKTASRFFALGLLLCLSSIVQAQSPETTVPITNTGRSGGGTGAITGRVVLPSGHPVSNSVRIRLSNLRDEGMDLFTDNSGNFVFPNLAPGNYTIEAIGDNKLYEPAVEQVLLLRGMRAMVVVHLREKVNANASKGKVISAAEVDVNIPEAARKEYNAATKLVTQGNLEGAVEHYQKAIAIYPAYLTARNDLGSQYLKLKKIDEAIEQFEAAIELNPKAFNPQLNLGIALIKQKKYLIAIDHLQQALTIDSSSAAVHLYLGIAAVETDELETAGRELNLAMSMGGKEFSIGHFYLAQVHMKNADREGAINELKIFIESTPASEETARAKELLKVLSEG